MLWFYPNHAPVRNTSYRKGFPKNLLEACSVCEQWLRQRVVTTDLMGKNMTVIGEYS